jgi:hypothetical protein
MFLKTNSHILYRVVPKQMETAQHTDLKADRQENDRTQVFTKLSNQLWSIDLIL